MIIGFNFFSDPNSLIFDTQYSISSYYKTELSNGIYDEYYIDEDITYSKSTEKPAYWGYTTVLHALFQNNLEAGSIQASGYSIEFILVQRRKIGEMYWETVQTIPYQSGEQILYEVIDRYVQNDFTYEYCLVPMASSVIGNRVPSKSIKVEFDGNFLTDKDNNYQMIYDFELGSIQHNVPSVTHETLNSQYPIITYSNTDYRSASITCHILTNNSLNGVIDIKSEQIQRERIMSLLKNKKPKVLRLANGDMMLISVVDSPNEEPNNSITGLFKVNFSFVEIGKVDLDTLGENGLLNEHGTLSEVY